MIFEVSATEDFSWRSKMLDWFRIFSDIFVFVAFGVSVFRFLQVFEVFESGRFETRMEQCSKVRKVSKIADFTNKFLCSRVMGINEVSTKKSEKLEKFLK